MPNKIDAPQITDNFIEKWAKSIKPELEFNCKTKDEFYSWKKQLINKIKELLGLFPEPSDLKPEKLSEEEKE
ncbi:MAG: hypothetical protein NC917_02255, partial [Candidatus Omnitrophica bacterium]|nr:hypothetical protein [Candidatus Omnitrophota bacterium]